MRVVVHGCPAIIEELQQAALLLDRPNVEVQPLCGGPEEAHCKISLEELDTVNEIHILAGSCPLSGDIPLTIQKSNWITCYEAIASGSKINDWLDNGAHFLTSSMLRDDTPIWKKWGFKDKKTASEYAQESMSSLVFIEFKEDPQVREKAHKIAKDLGVSLIIQQGDLERLVWWLKGSIIEAEGRLKLKAMKNLAAQNALISSISEILFKSNELAEPLKEIENEIAIILGAKIQITIDNSEVPVLHKSNMTETITALVKTNSTSLEGQEGFQVLAYSGDIEILSISVTNIQVKSAINQYKQLVESLIPTIATSVLLHIEKKRSEQSDRLARLVFSSTAEGIAVTDTTPCIIDVNASFERITGYEKHEVLGKNPSILKSGRHSSEFYKSMWTELDDTGSWTGEVWNRKKTGETYPELLSINRISDEGGTVKGYIAAFSDISTIKESQEELAFLAHHDALTQLPNRLLLSEKLREAINRAKRRGALSVFFVDLDNFKNVNDSLGHEYGDELLILVAERLKKGVRSVDVVFRIGGDEFVILIEGLLTQSAITSAARNILALFKDVFDVLDSKLRVTCSVGAAVYPQDGETPDALLKSADAAMFRAKDAGRNSFAFYDSTLTEKAEQRLRIESDIERALEEKQFSLYYQPQVCLRENRVIGVESLIRWQHPELGEIMPSEFIPIAEQSGQIEQIGLWVLSSAVEQIIEWSNEGINFNRVAVNVSGLQLQKESFMKTLDSLLREHNSLYDKLEIEVTETFLMKSADSALNKLERLKDRGLHISIDDFGTGYSSLSYLKKLPITNLKIDMSFVKGLPGNKDDVEICKAIVGLAKAMNLEVIAEGIETEEQFVMLRALGCDFGQGYLISKPLTQNSAREFLLSESKRRSCF
ncbi:hypothetical protein MACH26_06480 [Planctobacterium marinum]|uniref:cyclic-guanylate-specific phosphodiesterase n=2 Tax=Planctobacterium marinum TaxID=1631968 RepID=A0AA48HMC8_9ALTE|nr:hypothetical protein MACH26_06480 [Planctobacterium marinum]